MSFQYHDLGQLSSDRTVEITLKSRANVKLMDSVNFSDYKSNRKYKFYGGYATKSPIRLQVPHSGRWYVVIDLGGHSGTVSSAVRVI